jgi:hypothetical protein
MTIPSDDKTAFVFRLGQFTGYCLLVAHCYSNCYWLFNQWGATSPFTDKLIWHICKMQLFRNDFLCKIAVLVLASLPLLISTHPKRRYKSQKAAACLVLSGAAGYFFSTFVFTLQSMPFTACLSYMLLTTAGLVLLMMGITRLVHILVPFPLEDAFGRRKSGFPQEERRVVADFSLHLQASYTWKGERRDSWINLINPRRGIFILGSPGSGKSWFIIEPLIRQCIEKGYALFLYDFKYDSLTRLALHLFQKYRDRYPPQTAFYSINFSDLSRSHRCNILAPSTLTWISDALGASKTILLSMNKTWVHRQGEFFVESPINFLGALIWYLRKYKEGKFCTLPHAIELSQLPYNKLFTILALEPEIRTLINPFIEAYQNKTFEMLDSQISSAKIPLGRLASPDLYYVLTGNDLTLDINDPAAPKILCLGGDPPRQEALAPVLSLFIDRVNQLCNRAGQHPCVLACDEFATVRAYSMSTTIATARSNNIIPIIAVQDLSQLRTQYSREEADSFLNIAGNLFCGQTGGETARLVSERFPKILQERSTTSVNSKDTSVSTSLHWEAAITPATISTLSSGEFVGIVADDPGNEMEFKAFHAKLIRKEEPAPPAGMQLPELNAIDDETVRINFQQVKQDIRRLMEMELSRITKDPGFTGTIIK